MEQTEVLAPPRRSVVYALSRDSKTLDPSTLDALRAIAGHATHLVVTVPDAFRVGLESLGELNARVVRVGGKRFSAVGYREGIQALDDVRDETDEVVLTGDSWFGPLRSFTEILSRMDAVVGDGWQVAEITGAPDESFDAQEHAVTAAPWAWFVARRPLLDSAEWRTYWSSYVSADRERHLEREVAAYFRARGHEVPFAFPASAYPTTNAPTHVPDLLIQDGYPFLNREFFGWYPPYLDRHGIIGRDILDAAEEHGLDRDVALRSLAGTVPPKTLNANAGLLEILPERDLLEGRPDSDLRVAVVVYVKDFAGFEQWCPLLENIPDGYDLVVTAGDGRKAARLQRFIESLKLAYATLDVRVAHAKYGRDVSDFFVGCRDVILGSKYDVVFKLHARSHSKKTLNEARYFSRYQTENLIGSAEQVRAILGMFESRQRLGVVFPPAMHIGFSILGNGWGGTRYRAAARTMLRRLDVAVPLDNVSPLAPYGGMWVCRPAAIAPIAAQHLSHRDYARANGGRDLARVQERAVSYVAAGEGYYTQTVLTREHAAISHTALDYKVDQLFSTTDGYPVEQILLMQRAGRLSGRGVFGLSRMYLNLHHPLLARIASPFYQLAYSAIWVARQGRRTARHVVKRLHDRDGRRR